jgi:hypothetical protein
VKRDDEARRRRRSRWLRVLWVCAAATLAGAGCATYAERTAHGREAVAEGA